MCHFVRLFVDLAAVYVRLYRQEVEKAALAAGEIRDEIGTRRRQRLAYEPANVRRREKLSVLKRFLSLAVLVVVFILAAV